MKNQKPTYEQLENRLAEAEKIIQALERGEADAVISTKNVMMLRLQETEQALRESEERFRVLVQAAAQAVWEADAHGMVVSNSPTWRAYTGQTAEELFDHGWLQAVYPEDRATVEKQWSEAIATGKILNTEYRLKSPDGTWRWTNNVHAAPIKDKDGHIIKWVGMNLDITERKQAEEALRQLNETLEQKVTERTAQVQHQADQLRALASQLNQTEQQERKRLAHTLHDHVQQLIVGAQIHLENVVYDVTSERMKADLKYVQKILLDVQEALRSLTVDLSPPVLHTLGLIAGLEWLTSRMEDENGIRINLSLDERAEPAGEDLRFLLFECVRELILNVIKHAQVKTVRITLLRTNDHRIKVIVNDEGAGFDINQMMQQASAQASFGLFSIEQRLSHIGGRMEIESAPGQGTRITLTSPVDKAISLDDEADANPSQTSEDASSKSPHKQKLCRVLVVDDHKMMRDELTSVLQQESDIEVIAQASSGPQAIETAKNMQPDVVIMDVSLGDTSGVEATHRIIADNPGIKVIGLSVHQNHDMREAMQEAGASDYLTKGGPSKDLVAAIKACRDES